MPHLRIVVKGTFLLFREGVNSPMRTNFIPKITKIQELDPEGLKAALNFELEKKTTPPPLTRISGPAPVIVHCSLIGHLYAGLVVGEVQILY